jgi:hypothetical protein
MGPQIHHIAVNHGTMPPATLDLGVKSNMHHCWYGHISGSLSACIDNNRIDGQIDGQNSPSVGRAIRGHSRRAEHSGCRSCHRDVEIHQKMARRVVDLADRIDDGIPLRHDLLL